MKFHISRWHFWYAYTAIILLFILGIWLYDRAIDNLAWTSILIAIILLVLFEVLIRIETLTITKVSVDHRKGLFSKQVSRVMFDSITNVSVHQTFLQRILRFGSVDIYTPGSSGPEIVLRSVNNAAKIENIISGHATKHKTQHEVRK